MSLGLGALLGFELHVSLALSFFLFCVLLDMLSLHPFPIVNPFILVRHINLNFESF